MLFFRSEFCHTTQKKTTLNWKKYIYQDHGRNILYNWNSNDLSLFLFVLSLQLCRNHIFLKSRWRHLSNMKQTCSHETKIETEKKKRLLVKTVVESEIHLSYFRRQIKNDYLVRSMGQETRKLWFCSRWNSQKDFLSTQSWFKRLFNIRKNCAVLQQFAGNPRIKVYSNFESRFFERFDCIVNWWYFVRFGSWSMVCSNCWREYYLNSFFCLGNHIVRWGFEVLLFHLWEKDNWGPGKEGAKNQILKGNQLLSIYLYLWFSCSS